MWYLNSYAFAACGNLRAELKQLSILSPQDVALLGSKKLGFFRDMRGFRLELVSRKTRQCFCSRSLPCCTSTKALRSSAMQALPSFTLGKWWSEMPLMKERIEIIEIKQGSGISNGSTVSPLKK